MPAPRHHTAGGTRSCRANRNTKVALSVAREYNHGMDQDNNIWEQLETHIHEYLGIYGLEMLSEFIDLKEKAEDCGMCPPDTPERHERWEEMHG